MPTPSAAPTAHQHHLGMINPPRKAKRLRELATSSESPSAHPIAATAPSFVRPPTPPAMPTAAAGSPTAPNPAAPRRRGRKPAGHMSKSARDQLRKTNHSVIEKRRREKINEALAALRELVPNDRPERIGGERREDKEFKLEILVRTVEYLRVMVTKVRTLEAAVCRRCGGPAPTTATIDEGSVRSAVSGVKRKRTRDDELAESHPASETEGALERTTLSRVPSSSTTSPPMAPTATPTRPAQASPPRLPPISSWMHDINLHRPYQLLSPHPHQQLPSPPQSVPFTHTSAPPIGILPRLVLPAPVSVYQECRPSSPPARTSLSSTGPAPLPAPSIPDHARAPTAGAFAPAPSFTPHHHVLTIAQMVSPSKPNAIPDAGTDRAQRQRAGQHRRGRNTKRSVSHSHSSSPTSSTLSAGSSSQRTPGSGSSPQWSRDDQTAVTLLLNISGSSGSSGSSCGRDDSPLDARGHRDEGEGRWKVLSGAATAGPVETPVSNVAGVVIEAQTPSSVLGMPVLPPSPSP